MDSTYAARAKAFTGLIDAVERYKAFQTLEPTGLVRTGAGLAGAVRDAAAELVKADAAFVEESKKPKPEPVKVGPSIEDVKAAVVAAQKRVNVKAIQKIVVDHGGSATNPDTGVIGPSLKALPVGSYARVIAEIEAIEALPTTR
jgi:hypothetical protein